MIVLGVSKTTARFTDLLRGPTGHVVILMAVIYDSERIQSKKSRGRRHMGEAWRIPGESFRESSPQEFTQDTQFPQQGAAATGTKCCLPRKLTRDSVPRGFVRLFVCLGFFLGGGVN